MNKAFAIAASELLTAALALLDTAKRWQSSSLREMEEQDARNLLQVRETILNGQIGLAVDRVWQLETGARDHVPTAFWEAAAGIGLVEKLHAGGQRFTYRQAAA